MTDFDTFWALYPRRKGKGAARRAWDKAVRIATPETIMGGLEANMADLKAREPQYQPHPATWLNQERWEDEPDEQPAANVGMPDYRGSEQTVREIQEKVRARLQVVK